MLVEDIVLILHSYSGFPGAVALKGRDKRSRIAKGRAGGVAGCRLSNSLHSTGE